MYFNFAIAIVILLLLIASGCNNPVEQSFIEDHNPTQVPDPPAEPKLQISFSNKADQTMQNVIVDNIYIGNLRSGVSSAYIKFDKFRFDSGFPDENASAEVEGVLYTNYYRGYWCGTSKYTIDSGKFLIDISIIDTMLFLNDSRTSCP